MARFKICGCHVTAIGIIFDCINFFLFLLLLTGTWVMQSDEAENCANYHNQTRIEQQKCDLALGMFITSIVLTLAEFISTGLLITAILYSKGHLVIVPLIISYLNIIDALFFAILSILDICRGDPKMGAYIMALFTDPEKEPDPNWVLAVSITLSFLLVVAVAYCILNTIVHTRIWQYYKRKREEDDFFSETTSQISIIATFSMDMLYEEWRKKENRTITSIAEEDEDEEEDREEEEEEREERADLW